MVVECAFERRPAISPEELRLPEGYASKYSLLPILAEAGLPVARIITPEEFAEMVEARNVPAWKSQAYRRGFLPDEGVDSWAVDTVPSSCVSSLREDELMQCDIFSSTINWRLRRYLTVNFDVEFPHAESFLQAAFDPDAMYFSTWRYSDHIFVSYATPDGRFGVDACFTTGGECVYKEKFFEGHPEEVTERYILPLEKKAAAAMNAALKGNFCYKLDFLCSNRDEVQIIQARVASRGISSTEEWERIAALRKDGIPTLEMEVGRIPLLDTGRPFILIMINWEHFGVPDLRYIREMDLRNMQGLILPPHLRGGLLRHHGYIFIAYALYWGLPVAVRLK